MALLRTAGVAAEALSDEEFGSPRREGMPANDQESSAAVEVNSLFCSFNDTLPTDVASTQHEAGRQNPEKTKSWKKNILRALGSKSRRRPSADVGTGAGESGSVPRARSNRTYLAAMLTSIGSNSGRRGSSGCGQAAMNTMFNTTGTDIMESTQSDWAFNTVGAHPYDVGAPLSLNTASASTGNEQKAQKKRWWRRLNRTRAQTVGGAAPEPRAERS